MSSGQEEVSDLAPVSPQDQQDLIEVSMFEDYVDDGTLQVAETVVGDDSATQETDDLEIDEADEQSKDAEPSSESSYNDELSGRTTPKLSRELQSILALSKEAKLDTNIAHKRKSAEPGKTEKLEEVIKPPASTSPNSDCKPEKLATAQNEGIKGKVLEKEDNKESIEKDGSSSSSKMSKRKRESLPDSHIGGAVDSEHGKRNRKLSTNLIITMNNKKKDPFCWRCHHEGTLVHCETCPRSFHQRCMKQSVSQTSRWLCPECVTILKAENFKERSPAMRNMSLDHLCGLLKFALKRMQEVAGCEPFLHPVSDNEFPDYKNYIVQPMDLTRLEKNIKDNFYGSTQAFEADAKWILHNSIIFNSYQSKWTSTAKSILKICKQEMAEIENCASCYLNANTKKKTWFIEVCPKPHLLVWAKLKGFPYWPAKAMRTNSQMVDVRFFGAHDRAWVPFKDCFLFSLKDPNSSKVKRYDINESLKELKVHIENLKKVYGEFRYASYRVVFEPDQELKCLQSMLPTYDLDAKSSPKPHKKSVSRLNTNGSTNSKDAETDSDKMQSDSETDMQNIKSFNNDSNLDESQKTDNGINEEKKSVVDQDSPNQANHHSNNASRTDLDASLKDSGSNEDLYCSTLEDNNAVVNSRTVRGGKVRMRGGYSNTSGKIKIIPKSTPETEIRKRPSCEELEIPSKMSRRNSDQSVQSDSSHVSNISDKINRVDMSENMEILLGKDTSGTLGNLSVDLTRVDSPDLTLESKRKPVVQVNMGAIENAELTISPQGKSRIADRLMKKLTEPSEDLEDDKVESAKRQISDKVIDIPEKRLTGINQNATETDLILENFKHKELTDLETITELSVDTEIFETGNTTEDASTTQPTSSSNTSSEATRQDGSSDKIYGACPLTAKEIKNVILTAEQSEGKVKISHANCDLSSSDSMEISSSDDDSPLSSIYPSSKKDSEVSSNTSLEKSESSNIESKELTKTGKNCDTKKDDNVTSTSEQRSSNSSKKSKSFNSTVFAKKNRILPEKILYKLKKIETSTTNKRKLEITTEKKQSQSLKDIFKASPASSQQSSKRKRSSSSDEIEEISPIEKRLIKIVNVEDIQKKNLNIIDDISISNINPNQSSILKHHLSNNSLTSEVQNQHSSAEKEQSKEGSDDESIIIKTELLTDEEPSSSAYMEKLNYLSALNISEKMPEKLKLQEIRTRSKTDDKKPLTKPTVDNLSKVINQVAIDFSGERANEEVNSPQVTKKKEIFVKPLAKMQMQIPKQRARKSFPLPMPTMRNVYPAMKRDTLRLAKSITTPIISASALKSPINNITLTGRPLEAYNNSGNIMILTQTAPVANTSTVLPPNQQIHYTSDNPLLTMIPHPIGTTLNNVYIQPKVSIPSTTATSTITGSTGTTTPRRESQNFIPQSAAPIKGLTVISRSTTGSTVTMETVTPLSSVPALVPLTTQIATATSTATARNSEVGVRPTEILDELVTLSSSIPESLTKAISDIMCHAPPKLKPRPQGPLSTHFDEGLPSSAGTVTSRVNSISHRLGDYFRGMLIELLQEMGTDANPDAEMARLKLEVEELKYKHAEEVLEIKKNISTILKDIQKSIEDGHNRLVDETRSACETECLKRVEEAKSKQWCANCFKEAQFYCCWNTSYCDYPCQQKHWNTHMTKCAQNVQNTQQSQSTTATTTTKQQAPLVLRQTVAPKGFTKALIAKPTKVFVNRSSKGPYNVVRTTGSHITLVEATPGNYELLGNGGPISIGGKFITSMGKLKTTNVISATSPASTSTATVVGTSGQKAIVIAQPKQQTTVTSKTTTIISEDECD